MTVCNLRRRRRKQAGSGLNLPTRTRSRGGKISTTRLLSAELAFRQRKAVVRYAVRNLPSPRVMVRMTNK